MAIVVAAERPPTDGGGPPHAQREGLGRPRRPRRRRRHRHPLHRPAPRPRGHLAAGLRRAADGGAQGAPPGPHRGDGGPQRPHDRPLSGPVGRRRSRCSSWSTLSNANAPSSACRCTDIHSDRCRASSTSSAPSRAYTQPGKATIVCGDSHTATHGAFGALALGIGTSEVEHVLATQTLRQAGRRRWQVDRERAAAPVRCGQGPHPRHHRAASAPAAASAHVIEYTGRGHPRTSRWRAA